MDISITNNSKEHRFQFKKPIGKHFSKTNWHNLAVELPSEHMKCKFQFFQSDYNLPTVCFPDFMYLVKQYLEICMSLYVQASPLALKWIRNFSLDCRLLFWVEEKQSVCCECKSLIVLLCCECYTLKQQSLHVITVFHHFYLAITTIRMLDVHIKH